MLMKLNSAPISVTILMLALGLISNLKGCSGAGDEAAMSSNDDDDGGTSGCWWHIHVGEVLAMKDVDWCGRYK